MAKTHHKKATRTKVHHVHHTHHHKKPMHKEHEEKAPEYMVQISDPKMLRKDILESLREVIIFMQGYEKFRRIQEEKVALFSALKADVRDLNSMVENKLKKYLPQGKLRGLVKPSFAEAKETTEEDDSDKVEIVKEETKRQKMAAPVVEERRAPVSELDELESQLRDIEHQLNNIK